MIMEVVFRRGTTMTILLTIIHTNDLHANYDSWLQQAALVRARKVELEAAGGKYLLVEGGDHLDMSVNECIATSGRMNMEMIAELGYHAMSTGNNELLRSSVDLIRELSQESKVPWLLANLRESDGSMIGGTKESWIIDVGDRIKVGLFGATDQFGKIYEVKHGFRNVDTLTSAKQVITDLREQGANLILFLSHLGYEADLEMAKELQGQVDVIMGAHSHTVLSEPIEEAGVLIVQAGCYGQYVGELRLELDKTGQILKHEGKLHELHKDSPRDEKQAAILAKGRLQSEAYFSEVLTTLDQPSSHEQLVQMVADSLRSHWKTEIGIMYGGIAVGGLDSGEITKGKAMEACKSMHSAAKLELQGRQLLGLLKESMDPKVYEQKMYGNGYRPHGIMVGTMQFSGLTWDEVDGEILNVRVNGEPLNLARWYTVGSSGHLSIAEACGYASVTGARLLELDRFTMVKEVFVDYLKRESLSRIGLER
jgi:5'-nucleotidase